MLATRTICFCCPVGGYPALTSSWLKNCKEFHGGHRITASGWAWLQGQGLRPWEEVAVGPGAGPVVQSCHLSIPLQLRHQQWSLVAESVVPLDLGHSACAAEIEFGSIWQCVLGSAAAGQPDSGAGSEGVPCKAPVTGGGEWQQGYKEIYDQEIKPGNHGVLLNSLHVRCQHAIMLSFLCTKFG
ncbi:fibroblast growth factor receptor 3-like isoform X2 [Lemur catta]|uniref:fibroblast growth factor receptor 3-like isoform X2 n=1 Tax=Lemur catta TaxID=9447 RepID=UPI001E26BB53|nr:fibroblast growth factor receptor 3-like isoform X2 [Lemur catta]